MYQLAIEKKDDFWEVEALYDLCFAPGREALSSYRLRDDIPPEPNLSILARDGTGILAAAIRYWPVKIVDTKALLLGPIAVHPTCQGEGLGGVLIHESLANAAVLGWDRVLLVGDAPYYKRYGFDPLHGVLMPPPTNPERILGFEMFTGAWQDIAGPVERAR